jgi:hypothetical protein
LHQHAALAGSAFNEQQIRSLEDPEALEIFLAVSLSDGQISGREPAM